MSVRFKFKNDLDFHSVPCDGLNISVKDLKRSIVRQNKLGKETDFDLLISNLTTGQVYNNEAELIPKNTTVTVQRSPLTDGKKKVWEEDVFSSALKQQSGMQTKIVMQSSALNIPAMLRLGEGGEGVGGGGGTEEDKIDSMISNSTEMYKGKKLSSSNRKLDSLKILFLGLPPENKFILVNDGTARENSSKCLQY